MSNSLRISIFVVILCLLCIWRFGPELKSVSIRNFEEQAVFRLKNRDLKNTPPNSNLYPHKKIIYEKTDPAILKIISKLMDSEKFRADITFDSFVNGRKNVMATIRKPNPVKFQSLREIIASAPGYRRSADGSKQLWCDYLEKVFYLDQPAGYYIRVTESRLKTELWYTLTPFDDHEAETIRGSVSIDRLVNNNLDWRLSKIVSLETE